MQQQSTPPSFRAGAPESGNRCRFGGERTSRLPSSGRSQGRSAGAHACAGAGGAKQQRVREHSRASMCCVLGDTACTTDCGRHVKAAAADRGLSADLQAARQAERRSVQRAQCSMRASLLHLAALLSPSGVLSSIVEVQWNGVRQRRRQSAVGDFTAALDHSNQQQSKAHNYNNNNTHSAECNHAVVV